MMLDDGEKCWVRQNQSEIRMTVGCRGICSMQFGWTGRNDHGEEGMRGLGRRKCAIRRFMFRW